MSRKNKIAAAPVVVLDAPAAPEPTPVVFPQPSIAAFLPAVPLLPAPTVAVPSTPTETDDAIALARAALAPTFTGKAPLLSLLAPVAAPAAKKASTSAGSRSANRPLAEGTTVATSVPDGYVKLADVHKAVVAANKTVSSFVRAFGGDTGAKPPAAAYWAPVYVGRVRYLPEACLLHLDELTNAKAS